MKYRLVVLRGSHDSIKNYCTPLPSTDIPPLARNRVEETNRNIHSPHVLHVLQTEQIKQLAKKTLLIQQNAGLCF